MYTSFYGMSCNPFLKDESIKYKYESKDFKEATNRFNYLKEIKGVGLFCGESGLGKTYTIRSFIESINKDLYKVIYISVTNNMTTFDFFKSICNELNLDVGNCYKIDIYTNIQKELKRIVCKDKIEPIIIIDEAHLLSREILQSFKVFYDFEMDSKDYVTVLLVGLPELKDELSKIIHEPLKQRIVVNYTFSGLSRTEVKEYIETRMKYANVNNNIFEVEAINALYQCSKSSPRRLNTLIINSLMLGAQNNLSKIDIETIMNAKKEIDFSN